jgi:glycosyltransferase involved in cell wall biosynthesis
MDYVRRLPTAAPYSVSRFACARVRQQLNDCLSSKSPDVVVCDFLDAAINFPERLTTPSILFQHNVESEIWRRQAETSTSLGRRQIYKREFAKMLRYERAMVRKFDHVIAVSEHDRSLMSAWVDASRIDVVPTGVDLEEYRFDENAPPSGPLVVFVGAMDWEPNVDAVEHFCAKAWPAITARVPEARFRIVGRNPDRRVQTLAGASVGVTGSVPEVGGKMPAMMRIAVVLPAPLGPRKPTHSPSPTRNETSSTAVKFAKRFVRCETSIIRHRSSANHPDTA